MITKEVREWLEKVQRKQYSFDNAMYEFMHFTNYLTREEMNFLKSKLEEVYKS